MKNKNLSIFIFVVALFVAIFCGLEIKTKNIYMNIWVQPALFLIVFSSFYRIYNKIINSLWGTSVQPYTKYQNLLFSLSFLFFFFGYSLNDVSSKNIIVFTIWVWMTTYFMIIMSSNLVYKPDNQDIVSNIMFLVKISIVTLVFFMILISVLTNNNNGISRIEFFSKVNNFISKLATYGLKNIIYYIATISMIFEIIKLTITNFISKK